jgi:hypothetical protein
MQTIDGLDQVQTEGHQQYVMRILNIIGLQENIHHVILSKGHNHESSVVLHKQQGLRSVIHCVLTRNQLRQEIVPSQDHVTPPITVPMVLSQQPIPQTDVLQVPI